MKSLRDRRRMAPHDDVDSEGSWAVSYADMVTLLLGFFVLFFTVDFDKERAESLMKSLSISLTQAEGRFPSSEEQQEATLADGEVGAGQLPSPDLALEVEDTDINLVEFNEKLIVDFLGVSFFRSAQTQLTSDGEKALNKFAERYIPYAGQYIVQVQAFTDHRPVRSRRGLAFSDNLELSALRSVAAMRTLQQAGIPLNRMRLSGFGELVLSEDYLRKVATENNQRARLDLARKVVLVITPDPGQVKRETAYAE